MECQCPECGADLPLGEAPERCPACGAVLPAPAETGVPFDGPAREGFWRSLARTWRESVFAPGAFFARIPSSGVVGWPLLYAVLFGELAAVANAFIQQPLLVRLLASMPPNMRGPAGFFQASPEAVVLSLVVGPLFTVVSVYVTAGIFHALLALVGGVRHEFATTLRTVCYAYGTLVLFVLPLVGFLLNVLWRVALLIVGLAQAHRTETWRSGFAVLLPLITCCGVSVALSLYAMAFFQRGVATP